MDVCEPLTTVYLDFQKEFAMVSHQRLWRKLAVTKGIRQQILLWIRNQPKTKK